ncbi:hypothetical protein ACRRTK_023047 [Alexandromys fortis]
MGTVQETGRLTLGGAGILNRLSHNLFFLGAGADVRAGEKAGAAEPGAALRLGELELREEWQDEEFPRLLPEEAGSAADPEDPQRDSQAATGTPSTLALCGQRPMRKRLSAPELQLNLTEGRGKTGASPNHSESSSSDGSLDLEVDELETPSDSEQLDSGHEFEWEDDLPRAEGLGASEAAERLGRGCVWDVAGEDGHRWRVFRTGQREQRVDMTVIEPYRKVLSHGGTAAREIWKRDTEEPAALKIAYLFHGLRQNREHKGHIGFFLRLRKNLRALVVVHATWYVKAFLALVRPFISSKFTRKIRFLDSLGELAQLISLDQVHIPEVVRQLDQDLHGSKTPNTKLDKGP